MTELLSFKWLFLIFSSILSYFVGRKLASDLSIHDINCQSQSIQSVRDHPFISNIFDKNLLRGFKELSTRFLPRRTVSPSLKTNATFLFANDYTFDGTSVDAVYTAPTGSALKRVFGHLHHPGCPSDGEIILTQSSNWDSDFSYCDVVYGTRSGVRQDETQPPTCVSIVRLPEGHYSPVSISHRNGSTKYPQNLKDQYQEDFYHDYMFPKQNSWVKAFLQNRENIIKSFLKEMGDPIDPATGKKRTAIIMVANEGVMDFVLNFFCSAIAANIDLSSIVVFVGQEEYIDLLHTFGAKGFYDINLGSVPREAADSYADRTFTKLMWLKVTSVYVALHAGFDVIFQDADLVWIKDPTDFLHQQKNYEMMFMDDGARTMRFGPLFTNTGFYFIRNSEKTLYLQERLIRSAGEIDFTASHQATFIRYLVETYYLYNVQILILNDNQFPSGQMYHHQHEYVDKVKSHEIIPFVWHMCWTDNRDQKVHHLKDIGMWFLQESSFMHGMCENGAKMIEWSKNNKFSDDTVSKLCCVAGEFWKNNT